MPPSTAPEEQATDAALERAIAERTATIAIVGLGYVGLPLAVAFARKGYRVLGIDVSRERCESIAGGRSPVVGVEDGELAAVVASGHLSAGADVAVLGGAHVVVICVPTPLRKTKDPDISHVVASCRAVAEHAHRGMLVVLESTTYPGTTEELLAPALARGGLTIGRDVFCAFSPERIDPGNKRYTLVNTPKVVGGATARCTELAAALYGCITEEVVRVSSPRAAEMVKLYENTFRAVNIGLVNELAIMCDKVGVDTWEVIEAAASKPFGFMPFYPGPGLGGHCIPVDPHYLSWKLKSHNYTARFIELASEVNTHMPDFVFDKALLALNRERKCVNGARVLILGVSYKRDVGDLRESPAIELVRRFGAHGAEVAYHDPFAPSLAREGLELRTVSGEPTPDVTPYDLVVIATDHSACDYARVVRDAALVLDCRNATREVAEGRHKIVRL